MRKPRPHQIPALSQLSNGSVLVGGTGSGKSYVGLAYFYTKVVGGSFDPPTLPSKKVPLYIITTAMKRDSFDWEAEAGYFGISKHEDLSVSGPMIVDSWNNIKKYVGIKKAFFIFDEQRTIGYGTWGRTFIKIARQNQWVMLTATPADSWMDLAPIFVAHGFFRNKTEFVYNHVVYSPYTKFPKIRRYLNTEYLESLKDKVFVVMKFDGRPKKHVHTIKVLYDKDKTKLITEKEWNEEQNRPIRNFSEQVSLLRKIINSHPSRVESVLRIHSVAKKIIVFYNFNFELYALKEAFNGLDIVVAEHNGHRHDPLPTGDNWVYLVQYMSGNEAWECHTTNYMVFFSLNYSYRITVQSMGRINRLNTPYEDLYYFRLVSDHKLDKSIDSALSKKKNFNIKSLKL
jgi:hypothetical protein